MKKLLLVLIVALTMFSCSKQASPKLAPINGVEFTAKYGFELPFLDYGHGEMTRSDKARPKANQVQLSVTEDLVISGSISCTTSPDAEWGGIQKFLAIPLAMDGAVSYCNFNWSYSIAPAFMDCPTTTPGVYRGWTSDKPTSATPYDVHLSNTRTIE